MFTGSDYGNLRGSEFWKSLLVDLDHLLHPNDHFITSFANAAAFLGQSMEDINWCGFYFFDGKKLFLGPFCGKPACTEIQLGDGVCGAAARTKETVVVNDVSTFTGHIVCDADSRSEIVLPLIDPHGELIGVLDIDSPSLSRFDSFDIQGLEQVRDLVMRKLLASGYTTLFKQ